MFSQKNLTELAKDFRSQLPDSRAQTALTMIAEIRSSRKALLSAAAPLEALASRIDTAPFTELSIDEQTAILESAKAIRKALESHDCSSSLADPNAGLEHCDKDFEAFSGDDIQEYFECECHSAEHVFKFKLDPNDGEFFLSVHLSNHKSFFSRLWQAFKYVLGHHSVYGHWDEVVLSTASTERLHRLTNEALDAKHSNAKKTLSKVTLKQASLAARQRLADRGELENELEAQAEIRRRVRKAKP